MDIIKKIHEDTRIINSVHQSGDYQTNAFAVGQYGVTKIIVYQEAGEYGMLTFIAVYKGDEIYARLPANGLAIYYITGEMA